MADQIFNLSKSEPVFNLSKDAPNLLTEIVVGCSWKTKMNFDVDIDVSAIAYDAEGYEVEHAYHGNKNRWLMNSSMYHMGDDLTGSDAKTDVDNEQIILKLSKMPSNVKSVYLMGNVYDNNKSKVKSWNMCLRDTDGNKVLNADVGKAGIKGVVFAVLIRDDSGAWTFEHVDVEVNAGGYAATMKYIDAKNLTVSGSAPAQSRRNASSQLSTLSNNSTPEERPGFFGRLFGRS